MRGDPYLRITMVLMMRMRRGIRRGPGNVVRDVRGVAVIRAAPQRHADRGEQPRQRHDCVHQWVSPVKPHDGKLLRLREWRHLRPNGDSNITPAHDQTDSVAAAEVVSSFPADPLSTDIVYAQPIPSK